MTHWSAMVTSNVCMHVLFPYIQPVSLNVEPLHKSLLSASSNPKLGCLSDLIGYAPFVVLTEVCVRVCVREREQEWCWLSDDHWSSPVAYRECLLGLWRWCSSTSCPHTPTGIFNSCSSLYMSDLIFLFRGNDCIILALCASCLTHTKRQRLPICVPTLGKERTVISQKLCWRNLKNGPDS